MDDRGLGPALSETTDRGERQTRTIAVLSLLLLVSGGIALYAWIQPRTSGPSGDTPVGAEALAPTIAPIAEDGPGQGDTAPFFEVPALGGGTFSLARPPPAQMMSLPPCP